MRPWWHRAFAVVLSVWLVAYLAEPAALHSCPMHDGVGAAGRAGGHATHVHGEHDAAGGAHGGLPAPHSHVCTCLGACALGGTPAAPVPAPLALVLAVPVATVVEVVPASNAGFRPSAPEFARPPSIGPPAFRLV